MSRRTEKLADLLQSTLAELLQRRLKDPALEGSLISLTHVEVAPDLSTARVICDIFTPSGEPFDGDPRYEAVTPLEIRPMYLLGGQLHFKIHHFSGYASASN